MLDATPTQNAATETRQASPLPRSLGEGAMWALAGYGLLFAAFPDLARAYPFDLMFYGGERPAALSAPEADRALNIYAAVLGPVTFAWGTTAALGLRSGRRQAWNTALIALGAWFVVDTAASLAIGFWQNGATNVAFAAVLAVALFASRPAGPQRPNSGNK